MAWLSLAWPGARGYRNRRYARMALWVVELDVRVSLTIHLRRSTFSFLGVLLLPGIGMHALENESGSRSRCQPLLMNSTATGNDAIMPLLVVRYEFRFRCGLCSQPIVRRLMTRDWLPKDALDRMEFSLACDSAGCNWKGRRMGREARRVAYVRGPLPSSPVS